VPMGWSLLSNLGTCDDSPTSDLDPIDPLGIRVRVVEAPCWTADVPT
jgi:hypothetical protein